MELKNCIIIIKLFIFFFQVSVSTFKLNKIEFVYQSLGFQSSMKVQLSNLLCDDCSSISWDELQVSI